MPDWFYYLIQQLLNGLTVGSTYALIAIIVLAALALMGIESLPLLIAGALICSMVVTSAYGYSIERVAYRPLRGGNRLIPLISAIGMSIFLQNLVRLAQGSRDIAMPNLVRGGLDIGPTTGFHATLSYMQIVIFVVTLISMVLLTLFITRSRMGRACRACAEDLKM